MGLPFTVSFSYSFVGDFLGEGCGGVWVVWGCVCTFGGGSCLVMVVRVEGLVLVSVVMEYYECLL